MDCTNTLSGDTWTTFSVLLSHSQQSCYFLRQEVWQERTQELVDGLEESAGRVWEGLKENVEISKEGREISKENLRNIQQVLSYQSVLHQ